MGGRVDDWGSKGVRGGVMTAMGSGRQSKVYMGTPVCPPAPAPREYDDEIRVGYRLPIFATG